MWLTCLLNVCVMSVLPFEQLLACFLMGITIHNSKNNVNTFNLIHFILIKKDLQASLSKLHCPKQTIAGISETWHNITIFI